MGVSATVIMAAAGGISAADGISAAGSESAAPPAHPATSAKAVRANQSGRVMSLILLRSFSLHFAAQAGQIGSKKGLGVDAASSICFMNRGSDVSPDDRFVELHT